MMIVKRGWCLVWLLGTLMSLDPAVAGVKLNYSHISGSISAPYNDGKGGVLKTNPGPYKVNGNGTNSLQFIDPAITPPNFELFAVAGLNGFGALFRGSTASGAMSVSGKYKVTGAPVEGADGSLEGTATYLNFIAAAGLAKLLGKGTTSITSSISVDPFAVQKPGPIPNPTSLAAAVVTSTAGSENNIVVPYGDVAVGIKDGNYAVNVDLAVSASRTGGAVTAMAAWIEQDFTWTIDGADLEPPVVEVVPVDPPTVVPVPERPTPTVGLETSLVEVATAIAPENLFVGHDGEVIFSSVDPSSISNPDSYAQNGPSFHVGNAQGLSYLSDIGRRGAGGYYAPQGFGFAEGEVDLADSALMIIDPEAGTSTPVSLSGALYAPSALVDVDAGFGGADLLITELGLGSEGTGALLGVDATGDVTVLIDDLGIDYPVDIGVVPTAFGDFASKIFVLNVGAPGAGTLQNGTGAILAVDADTQAIEVFADMLNAPISMAFGDGSLVGDPGGMYLYVLEQGDQDPVSGILEGNGALAAFDSAGIRTEVANSIAEGSSLVGSPDGSGLYFSDGTSVFEVTPAPEPGGQVLLVSGVVLMAALRRRANASMCRK